MMLLSGPGFRIVQHGWQIIASLLVLILISVSVYSVLAAPPGNEAFQGTWQHTDRPVLDGVTARTWMWGPEAFTEVILEPYSETPSGMREVQYFDKARMEITNPDADASSTWYVTNGLLVVELISGNLQNGDATFEQRSPATVNVAGDADDQSGPTYATFASLLAAEPLEPGTTVSQRIDRNATVTDDPALASQGVTVAIVDEVTNHAIAAPFWDFMNANGTVYEGGQFIDSLLFENPYFATGRPITEAYWANVKVAGTYRDVLMQCFERRCLTYTPGNPDGFVVEAGNVGQHYYSWRYGQQPGESTPTTTATNGATTTATSTETEALTPTAPMTTTATTAPTPTATETLITEYAFAAQWGSAYLPFTLTPMQGPTGVAVDSRNHLWVMDTGNNRLIEYDEHGLFLRILGSGGGAPGQFNVPKDAAFGVDGRMYVADQNNHRIQVFSAEGAFLSQWGQFGSASGEFKFPTAIAISNGTVYVTDRDNNRIQMFDLNGVYKDYFGTAGVGIGHFNKPQQLAFDPEGNVYVVDAGNARVQMFTWYGGYLGQFGSLGNDNGQFADPHGIDIDGQGNVYVGDTNNNRIQKFDPEGNFLAKWVTGVPGTNPYHLPIGVEVDRDGDIYVADLNNNRVLKITSDGGFLFELYDASRGKFGTVSDISLDQNGNLLTVDRNKVAYDAGTITRFTPTGTPLDALSRTRPDAGQYDQLVGLAVNLTSGDIYVTDRYANRVQHFTSTWQYLGPWGTAGTGPGQFNNPTAIATDADGNVYVADSLNNRIQKFNATGIPLDLWGGVGTANGQFQLPSGIAIDGERIYVSDSGNNRVQVFNRDGDYLAQWGVAGAGLGELNGPVGIAVTPQGLVLVVDVGNNRVQIFSPEGEPLGAFGALGSEPGLFNAPYGIAVDGDGDVYVTDLLNNRVQKFSPVS